MYSCIWFTFIGLPLCLRECVCVYCVYILGPFPISLSFLNQVSLYSLICTKKFETVFPENICNEMIRFPSYVSISKCCRVFLELAIPCEKPGPRVFKGFTVGFHPRSWELVRMMSFSRRYINLLMQK